MNPPGRLLVLIHGFPPYTGGAENAAWNLARAAVRAGWAVRVLTSDIGGRLPAREVTEGMEVCRLPCRKRRWAHHTVFELLVFLRAFRAAGPRLAAEFAPSLTLAHFGFPAGLAARWLRTRGGAPYAVVLHGSDVPGHQPGRFGWLYALGRGLVRRVWRDAAAVVAVSEPLAALARQTWADGRIVVVPNGVDTERFQPSVVPRPDADTFRIVTLAQYRPVKGLDVLIAALAMTPPERRAGWTVDLYGEGPQAEALRRQIVAANLAGCVHLQGRLEGAAVPGVLPDADLFVLPSRREGLPLALLEAMASGLPVLASRVGGIPDVLRHAENGWLVEPEDAADIAGALARLAGDPDLRRRLGMSARRSALEWSWDARWRDYEHALGVREEEERYE